MKNKKLQFRRRICYVREKVANHRAFGVIVTMLALHLTTSCKLSQSQRLCFGVYRRYVIIFLSLKNLIEYKKLRISNFTFFSGFLYLNAMKNCIRQYFRRSYALFVSNTSICRIYPRTVNILPEKLQRKPLNSLRINRLCSEQTHQRQSDLKVKDVSISELLSGLNSRLAELVADKSLDEIMKDFEIDSKLMQCTRRLSEFTNNEILDYMDILSIIRSKGYAFRRHSTVKWIIRRLDYECLTRSHEMDLPSVLPMMVKFSCFARNYSVFLHNLVKQYHGKLHKQPVNIYIGFVEIINKHRLWIDLNFNPYEFEYYLEQHFDKLDIRQITILTHVLIQLNKSIVSFELKKKLFLHVTRNFDTMNYRCLRNILELFCTKESFTINMTTFTPEFLRLLDAFDKKINTFPLNCVALVGMLTTKFLVHKPEFLDKLYSRFLHEGVSASKRTIDYILYSLIFFNYRSSDEDVYSKIFQIINADSLKPRYKHCTRYFRLISRFCNVGVYNYDIINEILDEEYLSKTYRKLNRFSVYPYPLIIDFSVQIECPDYSGHRLNSELRDDLLRCYDWDLINYHSLHDCYTDQYQLTNDTEQYDCKDAKDLPYCDILKEISSKSNELYGRKITHVGYLLPHMPRPNLIFCLGNDESPQDLDYIKENSLVNWNDLDFRYKWYVVTVLIRNTFLPNVEAVPLGMEITKIRQLQKLNFNVVTVVQDQWKNMSEEEKTKFCSNLIR